jgi:hypothetical protein
MFFNDTVAVLAYKTTEKYEFAGIVRELELLVETSVVVLPVMPTLRVLSANVDGALPTMILTLTL